MLWKLARPADECPKAAGRNFLTLMLNYLVPPARTRQERLELDRQNCKIAVMALIVPQEFRQRRYAGCGTNIFKSVRFSKPELSAILSTYGRMVAAGIWRDYGISNLSDAAIFSVFQTTAEYPTYRIEKLPRNSARQGIFRIVAMDGHIVRQGNDLAHVLRVFDRKLLRILS